MKLFFSKSLFAVLAAMMVIFSAPTQAAMVGTSQIAVQSMAQSDINVLFERQEVISKLSEMGVDVEMAKQRAANLTNEQIAQINQQIESLPAGGDIVGIALTVFIVLVITDMLGATDVFPFVNKIN